MTTSSLGVGTGVDLQAMLTSILAAEKAPITVANTKISANNAKISLYGTLNSKLDTLQTAVDTLRFPSKLSAVSSISSDPTVLGASAASTAQLGSYALNVKQLASAQKSFTNAYTSGTTFGTGQLTFTVSGTAATPIDLTGPATLQEVGAQINSAKIGVTATVITSGDGSQRMILTGDKTGSSNGFSLASTATASDSQPSLDAFDLLTPAEVLDGSDTLQRSVAQDAQMTIDGISVSSSTNIFSSAIEGLTLTAAKVGLSNITVQNNATKITDAVQAFVDSYNAITSLIKSNSGYNSTTKAGQAFNSDTASRSILESLGSARSTMPASLSAASFKTLSELGITVQQTGLLALDSTKLTTAISSSPSEVIKTIGAYGEAFSTKISALQGSGGAVSTRISSLNATVRRDQDRVAALEVRVSLVEKRYRAQFVALDKYVSAMKTTSESLTQQLAQFK
jgi:flagellar hook-associated protein 2